MFRSFLKSRWFQKFVASARQRKQRKRRRLFLEELEPRILLDGGLAPALVVGRTLSSYFIGGVQNNQETITYTVYNEQATAETGVLLTDTLQPGVTFQSASQLPDQSGQKLAWSLGTIQGFDRASVTLTVTIGAGLLTPPPTSPLQLDIGAQAFATLDTGSVSNTTPAVVLQPGNVSDPSLLASTPDANTTDPYVQEEAAKLSYDPQQIFNFLENDVGYNSYVGSLRGARGTLWSSAGNALDVSSLGVALMRASGIPAQYVSGTLSQSQAQQLILSMFPASDQTVGTIPAGTQTSDPANDPQLLAETESHYWFQFDTGNGFTDGDPLMAAVTPGGQVGQAFTAPTGNPFSEVDDKLRAKTEVKLTAEIYSQAEAAFGLTGLNDSVVLDQTFNDVDLVGVPVSVGNFVSGRGVGALFSETTFTYSPYVRLGNGETPEADTIITGTSYQENFTNFPLGSQVLTGLFLDVSSLSPELNGLPQTTTFQKTLFDRIGFAGRQSGTATSLNLPPTPQAALSPLDIVTLEVSAEMQSATPLYALSAQVGQLSNQDSQLASNLNQSAPADGTGSVQQLNDLTLENVIESNSLIGATFLTESDQFASALAGQLLTEAYFDSPRVVAVSSSVAFDDTTQQATLTNNIDILQDSPRVTAAPGQSEQIDATYHFIHGFSDSVVEGQVLSPAQSAEGVQQSSAMQTLLAAIDAGVNTAAISSTNLADLDGLPISAEAKARITAAVQSGLVVLVSTAPVMVNGNSSIAWLEINLTTGDAFAVAEDGTHGTTETALAYALVDELTLVGLEGGTEVAAVSAGEEAGLLGSSLIREAAEAEAQNLAGLARKQFIVNAIRTYEKTVLFKLFSTLPSGGGSGFYPGLSALFRTVFGNSVEAAVQKIVEGVLEKDPELPTVLGGETPPTILESTGSEVVSSPAPLSPGAVAGTLIVPSIQTSGGLLSTWAATASSGFAVQTLNADATTVLSGNGQVMGAGVVGLTLPNLVAASISGNVQYTVNGDGSLAFYGAAESSLGVSGNWTNYSATAIGNVSITLTTDGLTLNGQALAAGTYTITTNSATLTGSGNTTSPNFSGSVSITATNGTINLGPSSGNVTIGGSPLDPANGATLTGYTGSVTVAAGGGNNLDNVTLNGNAANVLTISATPATFTTDQNTPITFQANVNTSFADTYNLTAQAPAGWTVTIDSTGKVTATPAPGLQSGTYSIQIIAQSTTNPDLVAQTIVNVTITPTQPGITFAVNPDPIFTVPFNGAQLPTAFRANIQNLGPAADTYNLTFANVPTGFTLLSSGASVTVPAGRTGILGLYLQPNVGQTIPPPGTVLSFTVTATSTTNPAITQSQVVTFTVPAIDALTITSNPVALNTTPGAAVTDVITITNVGNVAENNIALASTTSSGLTLTGLQTVSLAVGQSTTETITVTPDASTPLNSALQATITATFGASDATQTLELPVDVVVPGAQAIATAVVAAGQLGDTDLANRLNDLSTALTNLVQNPTSAVYSSQAQASLSAVVGLLSADAFLSALAPALTSDGAALAQAATASDVQADVVNLGNDLTALGATLADEVAHAFSLSLASNSAVILPSTPADFGLVLQNNGTQATTYDLSVAGLPANVTAVFLQNNQAITSVTLQPGETLSSGANGITLQLTETGGSLFPTGFTVTATAEGASEITEGAPGTITVRAAVVDVTEVDATPPYTQPGGPIGVTAKVLNSVNKQQQALASYTVTDPNGTVVFTSTSVALTLNVQTSLITVDLGSFATTALADGTYTINVTITDASGTPIPGATGQGSALIGTPVSGSLTVSPTTLPAGNGTVTNTFQINSQTAPVGPLSVVSQTALPGIGTANGAGAPVGGGVALNGNLLYASASDGIRVYDVTNPAAPQLLTTVGMNASVLRINGNELVALQNNVSSWIISVYSLTDPKNPVLLGSTAPIHYYNLSQEMIVTGTHVFVPVQQVIFFTANDDIFFQGGDLISVDISNPDAPKMDGVLLNTHGTDNDGIDAGSGYDQSGGNFIMWSAVQVDPTTLLVASTTATGGDTQDGVGRINIVDISDPTHMAIVGHLDIPGTVQVTGLQLVGNQVLVTASTGGYQQNFTNDTYDLTGDVVLAAVDVTAPRDPQLLHTQVLNRASRSDAVSQSRFASLGNGLYAFSNLGASTDKPELQVINAADPQNFGAGGTVVPSDIADLTGDSNYIYTTSADGLIIYQVAAPPPDLVTAKVNVPKNTVTAGSFNIAPTQIITSDPNFDTLEWDLSLPGGASQTLTWQSTVTGLQAGASQTVADGATISFSSQGTPGMVTLPPTMVTGAQILGLSPATQTVAPDAAATYTVTVTNPTGLNDQFHLAVLGVPAGWVSFPASVIVDANSSVNVTLTLTSAAFAALGDYGFTVTAYDYNGVTASVSGDLILAGQPPVVDPNSHAVVVTLTPASADAGQGTSAVYTVEVTNTGSADDTFTLSDAGLPAGVNAVFSQTTIDVPPGVSNFRDVTLTLTPAPGTTAAADDPFTVTATSTTLASVSGGATGTLNVVNNGVSVSLNVNSGTPGTTFEATITNTGSVTDTFDLSLGGPAALVASLDMTKVTLAPGKDQVVSITTSAVNFAVPGSLALTVIADSEGDPAVEASASANLTIADSTGLTASFSPAVQNLAASGMASFILNVNNTGNTEDAYTATITGSNGPVTATLMGLDGQPTQTIPVFRLPGLSSGAILLQVSLASLGTGAVSVQVKSMDDQPLTSDNTATVTSGPVVLTDTTGGQGLTLERTAGLGVGSVTYILGDNAPVALTNVTSFTYDGQGAGDTMTVLFANGEPLTTGGVFFNGPTGGAALTIDAAGLPVRTVAGAVTAGDPQTVAYTNVAATNLNNAASVDAFAGPDTADRAAAFTGLTAQERFVQALYLDELGRAGAKSELDGWVTVMNGPGNTQASVADDVQKSLEAEDHLVKSWYVAYLSRQAVGGEELGWVSMLQQGQTEEQVLSGILAGPEFYARAQTLIGAGTADERYVQALYEVLLNRTGESSGVASWLSGLPSLSRQGVALDFLTGSEFRTDQFEGYYNALLHRPDDPTGLNGWVFSNLDVASVRINFEAGAEFFTNG